MLAKVSVSALLFGNPSVFAYSLAGALASFAAMWVALRIRAFSIVGVSMVGGVFHMAGQAAVVAFVLAPRVALAYLPILLVAGLLTGALTGYVCRAVARTVGRSSLFARRRRELARRGVSTPSHTGQKPADTEKGTDRPAPSPAGASLSVAPSAPVDRPTPAAAPVPAPPAPISAPKEARSQ